MATATQYKTNAHPGSWHSLVLILVESWQVPPIWEKQLQKISVPELIDRIEKEAAFFPGLMAPQSLIGLLVRLRTFLSIRWRRNRCLLKGLLLMHFFSRAGKQATFHLSCHINATGTVGGHCWVSLPGTKRDRRAKLKKGWVEIYTHTLTQPHTHR